MPEDSYLIYYSHTIFLKILSWQEVLVVEAAVARSGRNLTVVASEFRIKKTRKLVYTSRATIYHMPPAKL